MKSRGLSDLHALLSCARHVLCRHTGDAAAGIPEAATIHRAAFVALRHFQTDAPAQAKPDLNGSNSYASILTQALYLFASDHYSRHLSVFTSPATGSYSVKMVSWYTSFFVLQDRSDFQGRKRRFCEGCKGPFGNLPFRSCTRKRH